LQNEKPATKQKRETTATYYTPKTSTQQVILSKNF